jgi:hypothetical protein
MEQNTYSDTVHNLRCSHRFTCAARRCPQDGQYPSCYIDKFKRYQPGNEILWYERDWEEINRITWNEVLSLKELWIYTLILITVIVFIFMLILFIKIILQVKGYY